MQHGKLKFKNAAHTCKYHSQNLANTMQYERVYFPNVADAMQEVLSPQCRLTLQNAEHIANATQTLLFVSIFFCLDGFTSFLTSWLCFCPPVHRNQSHKRKEITKTAYSSLHPNKDHNINSCWCVPPATPTPTTTTTATATTKATTRNKITITTTTVLPQLQIQQLQELQQLQLQQK